jgi:hypothetical protein
LRFLLADEPGAGKTIMAGLLIKELIIRGDLERCLVIAPGNLVEQWQDELKDKFDLTFDIVSREQIETSVTGNPFVERKRLLAWVGPMAKKCGWTRVGAAVTPMGYERSRTSWSACKPTSF